MQPLIQLALTLEIIDSTQATKLNALSTYVATKTKDLAECNAELARLQAIVAADIVEHAAIAQAVSAIVDATI